MAMIPWQYYRNLTSFQQQMNELFERFFEREVSTFGALMPADPVTTIRETRTRYLITIQVKGYPRKNLTVSIEGNDLIIEGHKGWSEKVPAEHSATNSFRRVIRLKHIPKADAIIARYSNDKLVIVIPKEQPQEPRTILITS